METLEKDTSDSARAITKGLKKKEIDDLKYNLSIFFSIALGNFSALKNLLPINSSFLPVNLLQVTPKSLLSYTMLSSNTIIKAKPKIVHNVARSVLPPRWDSGINSSTITKSIAPAEKPRA